MFNQEMLLMSQPKKEQIGVTVENTMGDTVSFRSSEKGLLMNIPPFSIVLIPYSAIGSQKARISVETRLQKSTVSNPVNLDWVTNTDYKTEYAIIDWSVPASLKVIPR